MSANEVIKILPEVVTNLDEKTDPKRILNKNRRLDRVVREAPNTDRTRKTIKDSDSYAKFENQHRSIGMDSSNAGEDSFEVEVETQ